MKQDNINWMEYKGAVIPCTPPHVNVHLDSSKIKEILRNKRPFFIRYTNNFDSGTPREFWYVIKETPFDTSEFSSNTRNQIKRGLKSCEVLKVEAEYIASHCFDVYMSAIGGYGRNLKNIDENFFQQIFSKYPSNYDYWIVKDRESQKAIAYAVVVVGENYAEYKALKFHLDYLKKYPSYALLHDMSCYYLNELKFRYVSDGSRSLYHESNVQDFLINKFKFRKAFCDLNVFFRKDIFILVKIASPFFNQFEKFSRFKIFNKASVLLRHYKYSANMGKSYRVF